MPYKELFDTSLATVEDKEIPFIKAVRAKTTAVSDKKRVKNNKKYTKLIDNLAKENKYVIDYIEKEIIKQAKKGKSVVRIPILEVSYKKSIKKYHSLTSYVVNTGFFNKGVYINDVESYFKEQGFIVARDENASYCKFKLEIFW